MHIIHSDPVLSKTEHLYMYILSITQHTHLIMMQQRLRITVKFCLRCILQCIVCRVNLEHAHTQRFNQTRSSAIAEGLHSALVSINLAITKQSTNDLEVYTPKVITFAAFR